MLSYSGLHLGNCRRLRLHPLMEFGNPSLYWTHVLREISDPRNCDERCARDNGVNFEMSLRRRRRLECNAAAFVYFRRFACELDWSRCDYFTNAETNACTGIDSSLRRSAKSDMICSDLSGP